MPHTPGDPESVEERDRQGTVGGGGAKLTPDLAPTCDREDGAVQTERKEKQRIGTQSIERESSTRRALKNDIIIRDPTTRND